MLENKSMRNINMNKKIILLSIFLISITLFIIILLIIIIKINQNNTTKNPNTIQADYTKILIQNTSLKEISPRIETNLKVLDSTSASDEDKYKAVLELAENFRSGYSIDHDPKARNFIINDLNNYAKENYPNIYNADNFDMACLDPTCGASINNELKAIIDLISNVNLIYEQEEKEFTEYNREVILGNLTNMALLSESGEQFEVISLGTLAIDQLEEDAKNYEEPSLLLKGYLLTHYNFNYDKVREESEDASTK